MIRRRRVSSLAHDRTGATIIEFAIVLPVMLAMIMGLGELIYQTYVQSILDGALQKAGRDSAIQGGSENTATIDSKVATMVQSIAAQATFSATRKSYASFSSVNPEPFTDTNGNGVRDPKECFDDINGNNSYDLDPGKTGQGGADDVTLYTVTVVYPRLFPVMSFFGVAPTQTISAKTLLKNQPYATQTTITVKSVCT